MDKFLKSLRDALSPIEGIPIIEPKTPEEAYYGGMISSLSAKLVETKNENIYGFIRTSIKQYKNDLFNEINPPSGKLSISNKLAVMVAGVVILLGGLLQGYIMVKTIVSLFKNKPKKEIKEYPSFIYDDFTAPIEICEKKADPEIDLSTLHVPMNGVYNILSKRVPVDKLVYLKSVHKIVESLRDKSLYKNIEYPWTDDIGLAELNVETISQRQKVYARPFEKKYEELMLSTLDLSWNYKNALNKYNDEMKNMDEIDAEFKSIYESYKDVVDKLAHDIEAFNEEHRFEDTKAYRRNPLDYVMGSRTVQDYNTIDLYRNIHKRMDIRNYYEGKSYDPMRIDKLLIIGTRDMFEPLRNYNILIKRTVDKFNDLANKINPLKDELRGYFNLMNRNMYHFYNMLAYESSDKLELEYYNNLVKEVKQTQENVFLYFKAPYFASEAFNVIVDSVIKYEPRLKLNPKVKEFLLYKNDTCNPYQSAIFIDRYDKDISNLVVDFGEGLKLSRLDIESYLTMLLDVWCGFTSLSDLLQYRLSNFTNDNLENHESKIDDVDDLISVWLVFLE